MGSATCSISLFPERNTIMLKPSTLRMIENNPQAGLLVALGEIIQAITTNKITSHIFALYVQHQREKPNINFGECLQVIANDFAETMDYMAKQTNYHVPQDAIKFAPIVRQHSIANACHYMLGLDGGPADARKFTKRFLSAGESPESLIPPSLALKIAV